MLYQQVQVLKHENINSTDLYDHWLSPENVMYQLIIYNND